MPLFEPYFSRFLKALCSPFLSNSHFPVFQYIAQIFPPSLCPPKGSRFYLCSLLQRKNQKVFPFFVWDRRSLELIDLQPLEDQAVKNSLDPSLPKKKGTSDQSFRNHLIISDIQLTWFPASRVNRC